MARFIKTALIGAVLYLSVTAYAGYQRGVAEARYFGHTVLAADDATATAPDWERLSPTFDLGLSAGLYAHE